MNKLNEIGTLRAFPKQAAMLWQSNYGNKILFKKIVYKIFQVKIKKQYLEVLDNYWLKKVYV